MTFVKNWLSPSRTFNKNWIRPLLASLVMAFVHYGLHLSWTFFRNLLHLSLSFIKNWLHQSWASLEISFVSHGPSSEIGFVGHGPSLVWPLSEICCQSVIGIFGFGRGLSSPVIGLRESFTRRTCSTEATYPFCSKGCCHKRSGWNAQNKRAQSVLTFMAMTTRTLLNSLRFTFRQALLNNMLMLTLHLQGYYISVLQALRQEIFLRAIGFHLEAC